MVEFSGGAEAGGNGFTAPALGAALALDIGLVVAGTPGIGVISLVGAAVVAAVLSLALAEVLMPLVLAEVFAAVPVLAAAMAIERRSRGEAFR
ncbi:MAG TPA: hypothetical protein VIC25_01225 [Caulobacteraceae bacterium]